MLKKFLLIISLLISPYLMAADKNQYGGYAPNTVLSQQEVKQLMDNPNYYVVQEELKSLLEQFYQERLSYLEEVHHALKTGNKIPFPPQLPELTDRQMSFMSDKMIARWNTQREVIKEYTFLPFGSVAQLETTRLERKNAKQQTTAKTLNKNDKLASNFVE